ncbi:hypothetical protein B0H19DRAFT_1300070, partial [Mycena capillaripes]
NDEPYSDHLEWDGWPDGEFSALFSMHYVKKNDNLLVHWATRPLGGRGGSTEATTWERGKLTRRQCQGVLECDEDECSVVTRPQTREAGLQMQLSRPCTCGAQLVHRPCTVRSTLHTFSGGVYYQNGGTHQHSRPTLLVGRPTADGPGPSVANISPLLVNADRVKYERRKYVASGSGGHGGDNFLKEFAKFEAANPNFIRTSRFGQVTVIVMQTPFMASRLVKSLPTLDNDAVGGLVSDAAHWVWRVHNSLLIVTSTYEPVHLKCWVPVLMSYSNGGTELHYEIHFFELFLSFAEQCDRQKIALTDEMLPNVVDFSLAERNGFISAFVGFWRMREPDRRTVAELRKIAPTLLKGCAQHFRNQITRVKKISGVVDPSQTDVFENYAKKTA